MSFGAWLDETLPIEIRDRLTKRGVDADAFAEWLGPRMGDYRLHRAFEVEWNGLQRERQALAAALGHAKGLRVALRNLGMRTQVAMQVDLVREAECERRLQAARFARSLRRKLAGEMRNEIVRTAIGELAPPPFADALGERLIVLTVLLGCVKLPGRRGHPPLRHRNLLLADVYDRLRETAPELRAADLKEETEAMLRLLGILDSSENVGDFDRAFDFDRALTMGRRARKASIPGSAG